jgi:oxygen-independent coproporphyrinogen III oxidase
LGCQAQSSKLYHSENCVILNPVNTISNTSLYCHIPFCRHRCAYCDFNTYAKMEGRIPAYTAALCSEIEQTAAAASVASLGERLPAHTIFFGGGTPSLLSVEQVGRILEAMRAGFDLSPGAEITLEANPGTVSPEWLRGVYAHGVNRLSFGMQSANAGELNFLERQHDLGDVVQAMQWSREAGFENLSLDLIFGLPEQALATWAATLETALGLNPEHISLYALTIEEGTPLKRQVERGLVAEPDDDAAADMYDLATAVLESHGYRQYEISNWARVGRECQHNLQYWLNLPYLGFGAGAHGFASGVRTANLNGIDAYIRAVRQGKAGVFPRGPANLTTFDIDEATEVGETMMVGLRLTERGVKAEDFQLRFGKSLAEVFARPIAKLEREGLVEWTKDPGSALRLTRRGRLFGNRVFREFI